MILTVIHYFLYCFPYFSRSKFIEFDLRPVCKKCYDKFPNELKRRQKKVETQGQKFGKQPAK